MKTIAFAAGLLLISVAAHAGTYHVDGVTLRIQDGCKSSTCVAVDAPGYGSYEGANHRGRHAPKVRNLKKDQSRFTSAKQDAAVPVTTATPPANAPEQPAQIATSDATPAK
jgi:hypothetical protein